MKSKQTKAKMRRCKRRKPENAPDSPTRASVRGSKARGPLANQSIDDGGDREPRRFSNVCPDCLNNGMFKAPIAPGGNAFYFYCLCSIGTAELAGVLDVIRIKSKAGSVSRIHRPNEL